MIDEAIDALKTGAAHAFGKVKGLRCPLAISGERLPPKAVFGFCIAENYRPPPAKANRLLRLDGDSHASTLFKMPDTKSSPKVETPTVL